MASPTASLVDPSILEEPVRSEDPLQIFKDLWHMGARGPLFQISNGGNGENGYYFAIDDWSPVRLKPGSPATFLNDRELLEQIKTSHRSGIEIVVHNRIPNGGFAVATDNVFFKIVAPLVKKLSNKPYIGINGYTNKYLLKHELVHHIDHKSGWSAHLWAEIKTKFPDVEESRLEKIYYYVVEAKAFVAEIQLLKTLNDVVEWAASESNSDEWAPIELKVGPSFRNERVEHLADGFNEIYAGRLRDLSPEILLKARPILMKIPGFLEYFDADYRLLPTKIGCSALLERPLNF